MVLKSPDIPSMLVETAYISNPAEERRLRTPAQQAALAEAIFAGLHTYFAGNPPAGTRVAAARSAGATAILAGTGTRGLSDRRTGSGILSPHAFRIFPTN